MKHFLPNLRHVRAFAECERQRSITRAAEAVFLSQSAVTQAISRLEQALGQPLFERTGTGVVPTAAGSAYAQRVRRALQLIESGLADAIRVAGPAQPKHAGEILPLLTTTELRDFVAVGTTSNFTLAAQMVGSSQPSVHRSTRELEGVIGFPCFEKTTRGIVLTRAGQLLWQQLKLSFSELAQGQVDVDATAGVSSGRIVIGCMPLARHFVMPEAIRLFAAQAPGVTIQVLESPYGDLLHGLRHGEIDFLVGALREHVPVQDVVQQGLFSAALCIAAGSHHPLVGKADVTVEDLAAYPWVVPLRGTPTRNRFERLMCAYPESGRPGLVESGSQILIRGLLMNSERLTLISQHQVQFEIDVGRIAVLDYRIDDGLRMIGTTTRVGWQPTAVQRQFISILESVAKEYSDV